MKLVSLHYFVTRTTQVSQHMREAFALPAATFACSATAAVLLAALAWCAGLYVPRLRGDFGVVAFLAFAICLPYVMIIGLPIGLFLVHKRMFRAMPALVAGAIAACPIPLLIVGTSFSGSVSFEGFGLAVAFLLVAALSGALSGLVFYRTHRLFSPGGSVTPTLVRGATGLD